MRILTAAEARAADREAIDRLGVPALVLMENAAIGVADAIGERFPDAGAVAIFCGPGNNGGDGLAVGRQLATRGYAVELFLVGEAWCRDPGVTGDAALQRRICAALGLPLHAVQSTDELDEALALAGATDLIVDALFGTGLGRPLAGLFAAVVEGLNELGGPLLAIDLPSGLSGSTGEPLGPHVEADVTVTFGAPKVAHILPPAATACGELVVADLGVPPELFEGIPGELHLLVRDELAALVPARPPDSHKGTFGHLLVAAGSVGKAGAAVLAARAAVRAGAGLVTIASPASLLPTLTQGSVESMTLPLPERGGQLAAEAATTLRAALAGKTALAIGPGLGQEPATAAVIREIVLSTPLPAIVDADALNAFAGQIGALRSRPAPTILTPHPGELGRLLGIATSAVQADRVAAARRAAEESGAVVVLKGHLSLVAAPAGGGVHVNPTGNPGMATGGTGDVLTGLLGALLAQGLEALDAARLGVYLHGLAGDLAIQELGGHGLAAGDLVAALPSAWAALLGGDDGEDHPEQVHHE